MESITFGTANEAKLNQIRGVLSPAGIAVVGLPNKNLLPEVEEDGESSLR